MSNNSQTTKTAKPVSDAPAAKTVNDAPAAKPATNEAAPVKETKGAPTKVSDIVLMELLPDERISRNKALQLVRGLGMGCSQARMGKLIEAKYGPAPERANSISGTTAEQAAERDRRARILALKEKALLEAVKAARAGGKTITAAEMEAIATKAVESVKDKIEAIKAEAKVEDKSTNDAKAEDKSTDGAKAEDKSTDGAKAGSTPSNSTTKKPAV